MAPFPLSPTGVFGAFFVSSGVARLAYEELRIDVFCACAGVRLVGSVDEGCCVKLGVYSVNASGVRFDTGYLQFAVVRRLRSHCPICPFHAARLKT